MKTLSPYSIVKLSLSLVVVAWALLAAAAAEMTERDIVRSITASVQVMTPLQPDEARRFLQDVDQLSRDTDTTVLVDRTDFGVRTLYVADGGHGARWLRDGYTSFTPSLEYVVRPLAELPDADVRQSFDNSGGDAFSRRFDDIARRYGAETSTLLAKEYEFFAATPLVVGVPVVAFIGIALLAYATIFNRRRYAILSLFGKSPWAMVLQDIRTGFLGWLPYAAAAGVVGSVGVLLYTSIDGLMLFGRYFLVFLVPILVLYVLVWIGLVLVASRAMIVRALAGEVPTLAVVGSGMGMRVAACIVLVMSCVSLWNHYPEFLRQEELRSDIEPIGGLYRISVNAATAGGDIEATTAALAGAANAFKAEGKAVEFQRVYVDRNAPVMLMNRSAADMLLSGSAQQSMADVPRESGVIMYPADALTASGVTAGDLRAVAGRYYSGQDLCRDRECAVRTPDVDYSVRVPWIEPGWWKPDVVQRNPLLIVAPDDFTADSDTTTFGFLTTGNILFRGEDAVREFQSDKDISDAVFLQRSILDEWDESHNQFRMSVTVDVVAAVGAVAAVLGLGLGFAYVCYLAWYQRFRVGFIFGLGVVRRFRAVLVMEAVTVVVALGLLGGHLRRVRRGGVLRPGDEAGDPARHLAVGGGDGRRGGAGVLGGDSFLVGCRVAAYPEVAGGVKGGWCEH
ncbi:hypothetical protein MTQ24_10125 [Corynebacterium bovis]|uniref:hypothetical protein n=1 Tax=Corynebacterium bovis TaxID=36808 RepID=UPI003139AC2F